MWYWFVGTGLLFLLNFLTTFLHFATFRNTLYQLFSHLLIPQFSSFHTNFLLSTTLHEGNMGRKCCFLYCRSNYDKSKAKNSVLKEKNDQKHGESGVHVPTFKFPNDDPEKLRKWIHAVPYLTEEQYNAYKDPPVLCEKHWPTGFETTKSRNGKIRPLHPPSVCFMKYLKLFLRKLTLTF